MKTISSLRGLTLLLVALLFSTLSWAQSGAKAPASPPATATGKAGSGTVTIKYSSPAVKGRTIWGGLEPYGKVWRAGANEATTVEFTKDVTVQGKPLAAGTYSFFLIPTEKEWTVIFNKVAKQWGAYKYDEKQDALRVTVMPRKAAAMTERLVYEVVSPGMVMRWENVEVPLTIK
ncbi:DUF2911 domain-containing protein [Hymenobacter sp. BT175]|uniref:DUF2911 domain-containing protein n=1 Tax=Hymenobacter translucens TaxID=2886507 RepID=UPI001D0F2F52|nr:DUF2911 domain-containing protein [Hymenobacter translucens]MCC2545940.1 DUF2911 domain-containing protein [Hymenobacter translucens]